MSGGEKQMKEIARSRIRASAKERERARFAFAHRDAAGRTRSGLAARFDSLSAGKSSNSSSSPAKTGRSFPVLALAPVEGFFASAGVFLAEVDMGCGSARQLKVFWLWRGFSAGDSPNNPGIFVKHFFALSTNPAQRSVGLRDGAGRVEAWCCPRAAG